METTTYEINLPCTEAYSIACGGITTAKPFDIHRHRIDEYDTNTYGKCIGNDTIIIKQRPKNSNGFYFRSILKFKEIDENKCLLSVSNRSKTFFAIQWVIFTIVVFVSFYFLKTNVTILFSQKNPPFSYLLALGIISFFNIFCSILLYKQKRKTEAYIMRYFAYYMSNSAQ